MPRDNRAELLNELENVVYWLKERGGIYDISDSQALKAHYKYGEMMSILERRRSTGQKPRL